MQCFMYNVTVPPHATPLEEKLTLWLLEKCIAVPPLMQFGICGSACMQHTCNHSTYPGGKLQR